MARPSKHSPDRGARPGRAAAGAGAGAGADGAAAMLAALAGFMVIGVFDSLLDVPRIALLFYMLLLCALLRPATPPVPGSESERPPR